MFSLNEKRVPSFGMALIPVVIVLAIFIGGIGVLQYPAQLMLIFSGVVLSFFAIFYGGSWDDIMNKMAESVKKALPALLILLSIGILIGAWTASGTIPLFVYYGLKIIDPNYLYVIAFIVTAIVSTFTGTSWGSAGTIGVSLMSIAGTMGLSLPITAGAVVSGAYFGDKLSPLSDTTNMSSIAAGSNIYEHIKHMLYTAVPSSILAIIVFYFAGLGTDSYNGKISSVDNMLISLDHLFHLNVFLLIPPLIVIIGSLMKRSPLIVLFTSSVVAIILALVFQPVAFGNVFQSMIDGFNIDMVKNTLPSSGATDDMKSLLNAGGLSSMYSPTIFALCAFFFSSALGVSGVLDVLLHRLLQGLQSIGGIIFSTLVTGFALINFTSKAAVAFFVVEDIFGEKYKEKSLHPVNLSRSMEDSISITEVLMPWTVSGIFMASTLGVDNFDFLPWSIFNLGGFVFSALYGFLAPHLKSFGIRESDEKIPSSHSNESISS